MNLKLKSSDPVETLRDQVREKALGDSRFKKSDMPMGGPWVADLIPPEGKTGWKAIITASDGKIYEVPFSVEAGKVALGDTSREVLRKVSYIPVMAADKSLPDALPLQARSMATEISSADSLWMFAPGGVHMITCGAGNDGGAAEVSLRIDETTATILQASLDRINREHAPQRAYFDKEHDEAAGATSWPEKFVWSETPQPGVYVQHKASNLGRSLVDGKVIRAFSPSFYSDADLPKKVGRSQLVKIAAGKRGSAENPARMIGLVFPACGTLTNNPAFKKILPLWANNAAGARSNSSSTKTP